MPRALMHAMPDEWQGKMAALLKEYDAAITNPPGLTTTVVLRKKDRFVPMPRWLSDYRRPHLAEISAVMNTQDATHDEPKPA